MNGLLNDVFTGRHNDLAWFMFINNDLSRIVCKWYVWFFCSGSEVKRFYHFSHLMSLRYRRYTTNMPAFWFDKQICTNGELWNNNFFLRWYMNSSGFYTEGNLYLVVYRLGHDYYLKLMGLDKNLFVYIGGYYSLFCAIWFVDLNGSVWLPELFIVTGGWTAGRANHYGMADGIIGNVQIAFPGTNFMGTALLLSFLQLVMSTIILGFVFDYLSAGCPSWRLKIIFTMDIIEGTV